VIEENKLPKGWVFVRLEDACTIIMGQSPPSSEYNDQGEGLPFFQGKAEFTDLYPTVRKWCTFPTKIAEANDILLSVRAPVGPTNLAPSKCSIGRGLAAIRPEGSIVVRYVFYAIRRFNSQLVQLSTGTTFEAISGDDVRKFEIPLAPLPEQQRIVEAIEQQFSRLDASTAMLCQIQKRLKRYRAALLKAAVEGKLTEDWRATHPNVESASEQLKRLLAERRAKWEEEQVAKGRDLKKVKYEEPARSNLNGLPNLPEGWCWVRVEQVANVIGGVTKGRDLSRCETTVLPYLRVANVQRGYVDTKIMKTIEVPVDEIGKYLLMRNDIVLIEGGDADKLGRAAIWREPIEMCIHQNHIFRARLINHTILPEWFMYCANSEQGKTYFLKAAKQTVNLASINLTQLKSFSLPFPPFAEQEQIVSLIEERLSIISELEITVEKALKRIERLRQSILHKAFTGKLVPQDPNDEPASVLLERIRRERGQETPKERARATKPRVSKDKKPQTSRIPDGPVEPIDVAGMVQESLWLRSKLSTLWSGLE
jgi:type I restriction enzyme, S subunit